MWWFLLWVTLAVLLLAAAGYGWRDRGWGLPYSRYARGRRAAAGVAADDDVQNWGVVAGFVSIVLMVMLLWLILGLLV